MILLVTLLAVLYTVDHSNSAAVKSEEFAEQLRRIVHDSSRTQRATESGNEPERNCYDAPCAWRRVQSRHSSRQIIYAKHMQMSRQHLQMRTHRWKRSNECVCISLSSKHDIGRYRMDRRHGLPQLRRVQKIVKTCEHTWFKHLQQPWSWVLPPSSCHRSDSPLVFSSGIILASQTSNAWTLTLRYLHNRTGHVVLSYLCAFRRSNTINFEVSRSY